MIRTTILGLAAAGLLFAFAGDAQAQWGNRVPGGGWGGPGVGVKPGFYLGAPGGTNFNPVTGSVYRPWAGTVDKWSGSYFYVPGSGQYTPWGGRVPGTGVYQNPWSGNLYNPGSGLYFRNW